MDKNQKWFVIYTKPRSEKKLLSVLHDLKVEAYLPLLRLRKKWSDRFKWVEEPIFPSYIFVNIDFQNDSLRLRKLTQVVDFVRVAGQPVTISQQDITLLQYS
ncbi:MAG: transcriptional antiterminator, partial [Leptonema sp. (in: Bacteria)]|nr:transcriptional antiterminator [Leptonema sp. (in: bacteria)]